MDHMHLNKILDIIHKRDVADDSCQRADEDVLLADTIEDILRQVYRDGRTEGIAKERSFWLGQEED